jgi:hypothetical protein
MRKILVVCFCGTVFVLALVFFFQQAALGQIAPMVTKGADPPVEGFAIKTDTAIGCVGNTDETESFTWMYGDGVIDLRGPSMLSGGAVEIRYEQKLKAVNGETDFIKAFEARSDEQPNLKVSKIFGYTAGGTSPAGHMTHEEKVGISNVNFGGYLGGNNGVLLTLCPWTTGGGQLIPAYILGAAAGSSMKVRHVTGNTQTQANTLFLPGISHSIDAQGVGDISAGLVVEILEGQYPDLGGVTPPIKSRTSYEEHASASGVWNFTKNLGFQTSLQAFGLPAPFQQVP